MSRVFKIINGSEEIICNPLGFNNCTYKYVKYEDNGQYFWRKELTGKLTFIKDDFKYLNGLEADNMRCAVIYFKIENCGGVEYDGRIYLFKCEFDLDRCTITTDIAPNDDYSCLVENGDHEVNVISGTTKESVNFILGDLELYNKAYTYVTIGAALAGKGSFRNPFYWGGAYNTYPDAGWMLYALTEGYTGTAYTGRSYWVREYIDLPTSDTPPIGFVLASTGGGTNHWVRQPIIINNSPTVIDVADVNPPSGYLGKQYNWNYVGQDGSKQFTNAMGLGTVVAKLLGDPGCANPFVSNFFTQSTNPVTGGASKTNNIFLIQKSEAKHPEYGTPAVTGAMKANELFLAMDVLYNVKNFIDSSGNFRMEHVSYFNSTVQWDISEYPARRKYTYDFSKIPYEEDYKAGDAKTLDFIGKPIIYVDSCISGDANNLNHSTQFSTDLEAVMGGGDAISDEGFLIVACAVFNGMYYILQEPVIFKNDTLDPYEMHHNNTLAFAQLHRDYQLYDRWLKYGVLNDEYQEFLSHKNIKKADPVSIPFCCGDSFDPRMLTTGVFGDGQTGEAEINIKGETLSLALLQDSSEADLYSGATYLKLVIENIHDLANGGYIYENMVGADVAIYAYADAAGTIKKWVNSLTVLTRQIETKNFVPIPGSPYSTPQTPIDASLIMKGFRQTEDIPGYPNLLSADNQYYTGTPPADWKSSDWAYSLLPSPDYEII